MQRSKLLWWLQEMLKLPNLLTLSRGIAAFAFLVDSVPIRLAAVAWAGISDGLDGWLARRYKQDLGVGALLDPIVDKFFMFFALLVLLDENKMGSYQFMALFARDIIIAIFGLYLTLTGHWNQWQLQAPLLGKLFTAMQFILLFGICLELPTPSFAYWLLILLGLLLLVELLLSLRSSRKARLKTRNSDLL